MKTIFVLLILLAANFTIFCSDQISGERNRSFLRYDKSQTKEKEIVHITRENIGYDEQFKTLGMVYCAQWLYYVTGQYENIKENGSFENWHNNMFNPHYDKDNYDYNLIYHTMAGNYYYLFYRSHGYSKTRSFGWSLASQLLFEFTIETATEQPSIEDIYQTPVLGALVGMSVEFISLELINSDILPLEVTGYLLNPFALLSFSSYKVTTTTSITTNSAGAGISINY